jgi:hypothetical protein
VNPRATLEFLARALAAARTNTAWPPLRPLAALLDACAPNRAGALGPPPVVDAGSGLPPYELWARLKADQTLARDDPSGMGAEGADAVAVLEERAQTSATHAARLARHRYHDALRALPLTRLGDLDVALKSPLPHGGRRVLAVLDKIEVSGVIVRLSAELSLDRSMNDRALFDVLFAHSAAEVEQTCAALLGHAGVREVERVSRGAVEHCAVSDAGICPPPFEELGDVAGAALCTFAYATCALDVTAGDNDVLRQGAPTLPAATPHRVFRDRKLVVTPAARGIVRARVEAAGTRTLIYEVSA